MGKAKSSVRASAGSTPARRAEAPARSTYTAYAVAANGSRRRLNAHHIVVDLGHARVRIDLRQEAPLLAGRLGVSVEGDAFLIVGPGDGNSNNLGALPFRSEEGAKSP